MCPSLLMNNYFLHFAGSWHECQMWKNKNIINHNVISEGLIIKVLLLKTKR